MCGIIGYVGNMPAKKILVDGLTSLEYRGYDSAGISFFDENKNIHTIKNIGKVCNLKKLVDSDEHSSNCGLGHTRWATHGNVTNENAHPHSAGKITLVHNGIIENYISLQKEYSITEGERKSQTDTEIAAILLNKFYEESGYDSLKAISMLTSLLVGTYSFCVLFADRPSEIYAIRKVSPLVCSKTPIGSFIASDLTALISYSKTYFVAPEDAIIKLTKDDIKFFDLKNFNELKVEEKNLNWDADATMKGGYKHYMLKEINEQPDALVNTIMPFINNDVPDFDSIGLSDEFLNSIENIQIVACGTARHAGLVASYTFSSILKMPINTYVASEYRYSEPLVNNKTLFVAISQSGETVDTLASLSLAKKEGANIVSVVNVKDSSIARESNFNLYTNAGPEIAVASTKAYTVQIAMLYMLFSRVAFAKGKMTLDELKTFTKNLIDMKEVIKETLKVEEQVKEIAKFLQHKNDCYYIGRLQDYVSSLEGALKLKEISYIHTDAYAAGELKHGTIALIYDGVPVIAISTNKKVHEKLMSNVEEVKARDADIILIVNEDFNYNKNISKHVIRIKNVDYRFAVFPVSVVIQLIAYWTSVERGLDVDKPRNLAKSVTVE